MSDTPSLSSFRELAASVPGQRSVTDGVEDLSVDGGPAAVKSGIGTQGCDGPPTQGGLVIQEHPPGRGSAHESPGRGGNRQGTRKHGGDHAMHVCGQAARAYRAWISVSDAVSRISSAVNLSPPV